MKINYSVIQMMTRINRIPLFMRYMRERSGRVLRFFALKLRSLSRIKIKQIRIEFKSIRFKVSVLYAVILGLILLTYSTLLYFNLLYTMYLNTDRGLEIKAREFENVISAYSALLLPPEKSVSMAIHRAIHIDDLVKEELFQWPQIYKLDRLWKDRIADLNLKYDYVIIFDSTGSLSDKSRNVEGFAETVLTRKMKPTKTVGRTVINNLMSNNLKLRVLVKPLLKGKSEMYTIVIATPVDPLVFALQSKIASFFVAIPFVLLATSFLGRFFVMRVFKPIREITETARVISHKDMSKRIWQKYDDAEIKLLVDAFNNMIFRLETSFKYVESFSSNVTHELKTSLAIIMGESEVALRRLRSPEEYQTVIRLTIEESQRMLKIIDDILLLTKLDYQPGIFKLEKLDLTEFFSEIYEQSKVVAAQKNIDVHVNIPSAPVFITANKLHLRRAFFNLINNAVKFTPKNGAIGIDLKQQNKFAIISVTDTGIGIAEETLPRIFERFYHIDRSGSQAESSNGLGLSIVRSILNVHQGTIDVKSTLGKGSTFTVTLPIDSSARLPA